MGEAARDPVEPAPGGGRDPVQRRTHVFALEQAEQMFRAAAGTGVATRPLLVFYGLSQAGRAITAAAASADAGARELDGHGIERVSQTLRGGAGFRVQALSGATAGGGG